MDDSAAQAMALRNIEYFGSSTPAVFRRETVVVDPITGASTPTVETETASSVMVGVGERVSETIRITDEGLIVPALTMIPDSNVTIQRNSVSYKVVTPLPKRPGSVFHYHELVVREIS
jgi:hypothetical protein